MKIIDEYGVTAEAVIVGFLLCWLTMLSAILYLAHVCR